jgi:hypothetical protein
MTGPGRVASELDHLLLSRRTAVPGLDGWQTGQTPKPEQRLKVRCP